MTPRRVTIVQRRMTHYRLPLFEGMRSRLASQGVELQVLHGTPTKAERQKDDSGVLPWARPLPTRYLAGGRICWQPFQRQAAGSELIVVTQENKLVNNLPLLLAPWRRSRIAFWGHGRNLQATSADALSEQFKRWTTRRVDWWFAYTELSAELVRSAGFDASRITVLDNSIDTSALRQAVELAAAEPRQRWRDQFGLDDGPVALYLGSLYSEKRIGWLLDAAERVQRQLPGFQLAIAGAGPDLPLVRQAAARSPFVKYMGSVRGAAKAQLLTCADLMLNPGMVGLGILDALVAGLPLITTDCGLHSPEIAYLHEGRNGLMTAVDLDAYARATTGLLTDPEALQAMRQAAAESGRRYSIENMVERFCGGVMQSLASR